MLDGSNVEGKFKTRKGLVAMKKGNLQVTSSDGCIDAKDDFQGSFTDFNVWDSFLPETEMEEFTLCRLKITFALVI